MKFCGRYANSSNIMKFPSPVTVSIDQKFDLIVTLIPKLLDLVTGFGVITLLREVSEGHLQRVRLAKRGRLLLRTPGPVLFVPCICSNVETSLY